jgi:hypothetical protein
MPRGSAFSGVLSWSLLLVLYLLLSGNAGLSEVAAGSAAASFVLFLLLLLRDQFKRPLLIKAHWLLLLWRIPVAMFSESWLLTIALLRQLRGGRTHGHLLRHPYTPPADGHQAARIAFMTFGVCITPNSYLVFHDRAEKQVLVRQLVGERISKVDRLFVELP